MDIRQGKDSQYLMIPVYFLPAAEAELLAAQAWYDERGRSLGDRFLFAIDAVMSRIADNAWQFPIARADLRRALVPRFPYALFFRIEADGVYVLACAHSSRAPFYWRRT